MPSLPQPLLRVPAKDELILTQKRLIAGRKELIEKIVATVDLKDATFDNVYAPILRYDDSTLNDTNITETLKYAALDADVQSEAEAAMKLWSDHYTWAEEQDKLLQLRFAAGERTEDLDAESKRRLEKKIEYLKRMGHGTVDEETRKAYQDTSKEIDDICREMNRNIRLYDGGNLGFTEKELDGLDEQEFQQYDKDESGKRLVPMTRANYTKIMASASNPNTRKSFHEKWRSRLPENVPMFRKVILLRDENARRLGYHSDADLCLGGRMAKSTEWVEELLADLTDRLLGPGRKLFRNIEEIKANLIKQGCKSVDASADSAVQGWEVAYLKEIEGKQHSVDHKAISAYLPFKETTAAILRNITNYFQLRLEAVAKEELEGCIWSDDVDVWAVWDESPAAKGEFVGYFYSDLLDRPNKYKHNQTVELQAVSAYSH